MLREIVNSEMINIDFCPKWSMSGPETICAISEPRNKNVSTPPIAANEDPFFSESSPNIGPILAWNKPKMRKIVHARGSMILGDMGSM
jgi:hypothetical protein